MRRAPSFWMRKNPMKLNHLNLVVPDVRQTRDFLQTYFGLRPSSHNPDNDNFVMMFDDDDFLLSLTQASENSPPRYPAAFHVGFMQNSEEKVNEINQRLKDDGFDVKPPRRIHGSWTFYLQIPGGFLIEVLY